MTGIYRRKSLSRFAPPIHIQRSVLSLRHTGSLVRCNWGAEAASPLLSDELEGGDRRQRSRLARRAGISATLPASLLVFQSADSIEKSFDFAISVLEPVG